MRLASCKPSIASIILLPSNCPSVISSSSEAFDAIQPGDVLFSNTVNGGNGHVMLVVGKSGDIVTIAENGRKTRQLNRSELTGGNTVMTYSILLLDDYYANTGNRNSLY